MPQVSADGACDCTHTPAPHGAWRVHMPWAERRAPPLLARRRQWLHVRRRTPARCLDLGGVAREPPQSFGLGRLAEVADVKLLCALGWRTRRHLLRESFAEVRRALLVLRGREWTGDSQVSSAAKLMCTNSTNLFWLMQLERTSAISECKLTDAVQTSEGSPTVDICCDLW